MFYDGLEAVEVCHRILVVAQTSRTRRICCVLSYLYICMLYVCSDLVNQLLDVGRMVAQTEHRRWKRYSRFLCSVLTYLLIKTREARPGPGNCQDSPAPPCPAPPRKCPKFDCYPAPSRKNFFCPAPSHAVAKKGYPVHPRLRQLTLGCRLPKHERFNFEF